jgi:Ca-activated chloride channel family protein
MIWENVRYLWIITALPLLLGAGFLASRSRRKRIASFFSEPVAKQLFFGVSNVRAAIRTVLFAIGFVLLAVAVAGPKIGTQVKEVKRKGVDLMIALDVSASMKAEDLRPNRLEKAKYEIRRLIDQLAGDRVGLIIFTGEAFLQSPITQDYSALRLFLNIVDTDQMPSTTTNLSAALSMAASGFRSLEGDKTKAARVLLVISDGEDHGDDFSAALDEVRKENVTVFTVGIGTRTGATIPLYDKDGRLLGYKRDKEGRIVTTKLNSEKLQQLAAAGGGHYFEIGRGNDGIDAFKERLEQFEKGEFATQEYADYKNQYQLLAALSLVFITLSVLFPVYKKPSVPV